MLNKKKERKQNGLLFYSPLKNEESAFFNLGDCIQSLAAKQFFDHIDVYINREETNLYDCSPVKLIMNGWFMHNPYNWPPSDKIQPLFISFHINEYVRSILTSPFSIDYLKQYEPIGCRDINTYKLLNEKGVKAYFSACLTLTLNRTIKNNSSRDIVYIVDPIVDHYINNHLTLKNSFYCLWTLFSHFSFLLKLKRKYSSDLQYTFSFDRIGVKKLLI